MEPEYNRRGAHEHLELRPVSKKGRIDEVAWNKFVLLGMPALYALFILAEYLIGRLY